ncbi:MAG: DUF2130 domain-containing protein [Deltaproteobacteria bacterium]|nr:DUF2130 domain-containing protein [Deltaproteobacteria bacterium]
MTEPTLTCPNCNKEIKLTDSFTAPLLAPIRRHYDQKMEQNNKDIAEREKFVRDKEKHLADEKKSIEEDIANKVSEQLKLDRTKIAAEEAKKAKLASATDIEQKTKELADLQEVLTQRDVKLAEAQKSQAEFLKQKRALEDKERELDLTVEKKIQEGIGTARERAKTEASEEFKLGFAERDKTITDLQVRLQDALRKSEQGSQQLQGEVLELELELLLKTEFPLDNVEAIAKGERGADILQNVISTQGQACGAILWESKRTKNWSKDWLPKLREDQRIAKAEIAIIVSQVLPKGVETFEMTDGVWVVHPRVMIPVAMMLRYTLIEISMARKTSEGQKSKMEMVYQYLTGPQFRQRVEAIVEAFSSMKEDLEKEKTVMTKQWAKREKQIERVMQSTVGMYGDLQGIAGKTLQEIEGLEMKALGEGDPTES